MITLNEFPYDLFADYIEGRKPTAKEASFNFNEEGELQEITDFRNNTLFQVACNLHKSFVDKKLAWATYKSFVEKYCPSLLKEQNGWKEIKAVFKSAKSRIANKTQQKPGIKNDLVLLLNSTEILTREVDPIQWIIPHYLPKGGVTGLVGEAGAGKTMLGMRLTICILTGKRFLDNYEAEKGTVLYVNVDMPFAVFQQRAKLLGLPKDMPYYTFEKRQFSVEKYGDELLELIKEIKPTLVVFDTLRKIHNKQENDSTEMQEIFNYFTKITDIGSSVLFLHHVAKNQYAYKGSTVIRDSVDVMLVMDKVKDCKLRNEFTIKFDKVRLEAETEAKDIKVRLINKNGLLEFEEVAGLSNEETKPLSNYPQKPSRTTKEKAQQLIISKLLSDKVKRLKETSKESILEEANIQNLNLRKVEDELQMFVTEGKLERSSKGAYKLVEGGTLPST